jgi:hypothetical protein
MTAYPERSAATRVRTALAAMPVVVLTGLRQVGKSTFLQRTGGLHDRLYVTFDDFSSLEIARNAPEVLVAQDRPVTIDEAHKLPTLLPLLKQAVDRDRRPGRFLLSGSADFALLREVSESLAGRAVYLTLHPFTRRERDGRALRAPTLVRLAEGRFDPTDDDAASVPRIGDTDVLTGGLAPVATGVTPDPALWFRGYEQTYLERDVRDLARATDLASFRQVLRLVALRTATVLNTSSLARDAKLPASSVARYLDLLELSFVIRRLPPYLSNRTSRLVKAPKLYFADSGLAAHVAGVRGGTLPADDPLHGPLLETWFAQNLAALVDDALPGATLAYWHEQGRHEVDFVIDLGRECLAIEVKRATRWNDDDLSGLRAFLDRTPHCRMAVLAYGGTSITPLGPKLWALPMGLVLG